MIPAVLLCLDLDGTLIDGALGPVLPGAIAAIALLRGRGVPLRFVTNTTSKSRRSLVDHLSGLGLLASPSELVTPSLAARQVMVPRGHTTGILIVDPPVREDFAWFEERPDGAAVLLGTEGHDMRIANLQVAFRRILDGAAFYTLQRNRYFRKGAELVTDLGPVAAFLGCAGGREAELLGKPSPLLFDALAAGAGVARHEIVMVGDDAELDVAACVALGMRGVLVRTGKYRAGDEARVRPAPTAVLDSIEELPAFLDV
ncbi:MAG: HAD hydrolase-like protein [Acidobacteriota bacterium]